MTDTAKRKKEIREVEDRMSLENRQSDLRRARSVTVGTAFGGTTEVMLRGNDGNILWAILQPVEVIELIHQLAANVGCHIQVQPRADFGSWRQWNYTEEELKHYRDGGAQLSSPGVGCAPMVNDMAPHQNRGQVLPPPEQQPGIHPASMAKETNNEQPVATKKTVKRRSTKRTAKTA